MKQFYLLTALLMGVLAGCEKMDAVKRDYVQNLESIPEIYDDAEPNARSTAATVGAYLVFKVTYPVATSATTVATTGAALAYSTTYASTGDVLADSVTTRKGWTKFSIKSDKIGQYVKKKTDSTKVYHWYILDRDYKIYREVGFTGLNEPVFSWIGYYKNAVIINGANRPIAQSTQRQPLQ